MSFPSHSHARMEQFCKVISLLEQKMKTIWNVVHVKVQFQIVPSTILSIQKNLLSNSFQYYTVFVESNNPDYLRCTYSYPFCLTEKRYDKGKKLY